MSAILSADDLNDFISPSVACIKPVETLPSKQASSDPSNPYEVTTEDAAHAANAPPAQISLTDCLACSGCVTSAEAVLVSLQSYQEVLTTLDAYPSIPLQAARLEEIREWDGKIFVASVSPQARASIAATFGVSERAAGNMIENLLAGDGGLRAGGAHGSGFTWVLDTNVMRDVALFGAVAEIVAERTAGATAVGPDGDFTRLQSRPKRPILTSACPGWICYAEKTHPHVLPHVSKIKSPQALTGTLVKTVLAKTLGISPSKIWHMAVMPCFDKKLEASREELTDMHWSSSADESGLRGIRDVDLVITSRELLSLASARNIPFHTLPRRPIPAHQRTPFPDRRLEQHLFRPPRHRNGRPDAGSSGGYLQHIIRTTQLRHAGSTVQVQRGRNSDVVEYTVTAAARPGSSDPAIVLRAARYYGFRNIQNLVRRLRPARPSKLAGAGRRTTSAAAKDKGLEAYDYVEVMACPGGCTNGGGQIKVDDVVALREGMGGGETVVAGGKPAQREWLEKVDEAYFSASSGDEQDGDGDVDMAPPMDDTEPADSQDVDARGLIQAWVECTGIDADRLMYTTYRKVESDVGKKKGSDVERVAGLASSIGGGW